MPSCENNGYDTYGCTRCEAERTINTGRNAHSYTETKFEATCESKGYVLHDCDNCDYSYKDEYVLALGHSYEVSEWQWSEDNLTAKLILVCGHDETHIVELDATVTKDVFNGTCSDFVRTTYTATVVYDKRTFKDEKVFEVGTPGHIFSDGWTYDESAHWHACICGEKSDVTEHTFEDEAVTKNASCNTAGEKTSYCACGATKKTAIPATGKHTYENGACTGCGKPQGDCDHTSLTEKTLDLGALGACEWSISYDSCACGEIKTIGERNLNSKCEFSYDDIEYEEFIDENGHLGTSETAVCTICGLQATFAMVQYNENCVEKTVEYYTLVLDGVTLIENLHREAGYVYHNEEVITIDLIAYGGCEGTAAYLKCADCGTVTQGYFNVHCKTVDTTEEIVKDGVTHTITTRECMACGLKYIIDTWSASKGTCYLLDYESLKIYKDDECIFEYCYYIEREYHDLETEYTLWGDTCEDGYEFVSTCRKCGYVEVLQGSGCPTEREEVDLKAYDCCVGTISYRECQICKKKTMIVVEVNGCQTKHSDETVVINGIEHSISTETCLRPSCKLKVVTDIWWETESTCVKVRYRKYSVYKGDQLIFEGIESTV
ncbi:MAG: hypothetical protein J6U68_03235, partial [Clostridia bacterium]|nr:hypothetical protein [Clostridia bacterium]